MQVSRIALWVFYITNLIAETKNKIIMGIAHKKKKIFGLQFHPESIGTKNGKKILKNFLKEINYEF